MIRESLKNARKNSFRSAEKVLMLPVALTKEKTSQFELGPFQRFQGWPAISTLLRICEPTGWMLCVEWSGD